MLIFNQSGTRIRGLGGADDFSFSVVEKPVGGTTAVTSATVNEAVVQTTTTSATVNNAQVILAPSLVNANKVQSFTALNPAVATIDGNGNIQRVSDGQADFDIVCGGIGKRYTRNMSSSGASLSYQVTSYLTNSLGAVATSVANALVSGKTAQGNTSGPGGVQNLFSVNNYNSASPVVTRNAACFAAAYDWSGISVMRSDQTTSGAFPVALVTPRHILCARHIAPAIGTTVVFQSMNGVSIQSATVVSEWDDPTTDHWIGYLSAPINSPINPVQIPPSGWTAYINSLLNSPAPGTIPCMCKVQHMPNANWDTDRITLMELYAYTTPGNVGNFLNIFTPSDSPRYSWASPIVPGDSSGPIFMPLSNNTMMLLGQLYAPSGAFSIEAASATLQAQMHTLAAAQGDNTSYAFLRANLSSFSVY